MNEELSKLNIRIPKVLHDKLRVQAKVTGKSIQDVVTDRLESDPFGVEGSVGADVLSALMQTRSSNLYGDETVFNEILRRVVAIQLIAANNLAERVGIETAQERLGVLDTEVRKVLKPRTNNG